MKLLTFLVIIFSITLIVGATVEEFGYSNPSLPIIGAGSNVSLQTVNNSLFWAGYPFDIDRWMLPDGSNSDNVVTFTENIEANNATFEYVNVTKDLFVSNSTLYIGNVSISSSNGGGEKILNISATEVRATYFVGDGSRLTNISFENGTVIAQGINASIFYGGNFTGDNVTALNFFGGNFFGNYDFTVEEPYLSFNGTFIGFNETYLEEGVQSIVQNLDLDNITLNGETITSWSEVNYTVGNDTITYTTPSFSGTYSVVLPEKISFEITQLIVEPSSPGLYRFGMYEASSGETIDADLIYHVNNWNIMKSYTLDNQVSVNFSNSAGTRTFNVTIKYINNVAN